MAPKWLTQLFCHLTARKCFAKEQGKEIRWNMCRNTYAIASEEKGVRGPPPMVWRFERRPKVPRQKSLNKTWEIKQKPTKEPSEFLERIYQVYRSLHKYRPWGPWEYKDGKYELLQAKHSRDEEITKKLDGEFEMNPSQLGDVVFKVQQWETNDRSKEMQKRI